ncbi:MAG: hypothetical protein HYY45_13230 [Deltaproteobacteria bacterium]|nr:hypothetical protein [Deltaproteobacteria bacterium]
MAKRSPAKRLRTIDGRFTSLERLVRAGFQQTESRFRGIESRFRAVDSRFRGVELRFRALSSNIGAFRKQTDTRFRVVHLELRNLRKEINDSLGGVGERIDRLANHVDGFTKLHETLDIEMKVIKEQMNRFDQRLSRLEAAQAS